MNTEIETNKKTKFNLKNYLKKKLTFWNIVTILLFIALGIVLVYPFSALISRSFIAKGGEGFTLDYYKDFFTLPYYYESLKNSLSVSLAATFFATIIGIPMAYAWSRFNIRGKKVLNIMVVLSLMSPPFIGAYSWVLLLGRNGFLTKLFAKIGIILPTIYGWSGIVLVFTLKFFPYIFLYVSAALKSMDASLEESAENLGVSGIKKLMTVTFPLILPTISAGALMVFMTSLADFGTPMLIGEGYKVLPVLVYNEFMSEIGGNAAMASALSVIIVFISVSILVIQNVIVSRKNYMMSSLRPVEVKELKPWPRRLATFGCFLVAGVAMAQQVVVLVTSFIKTSGPIFVKGFSLNSYKLVWNRLSRNITNTFLYATIAIVIIVVLGLLISYISVRRRNKVTGLLDILVMFPYVIPGAVLGITLLVAFNKPPIMISGTFMIMILAYVIRKLPYTVRSSTAILHQIDPSVEEASINLGVSPMKTFFKVTAVMMAPGVFSGAILSWVTTINELSSSIILYTGKTSTISVAIYTEVIRASFGTAAALASILTVATTISLLIFYRVSGGEEISL
ncbi:MAG: iron ABC transporter permease [Clostridium sp.]|nr:iron ABC transporter permease [Clostridium sp.]